MPGLPLVGWNPGTARGEPGGVPLVGPPAHQGLFSDSRAILLPCLGQATTAAGELRG